MFINRCFKEITHNQGRKNQLVVVGRSRSSEEKLALLRQIQEAYGKCKEFGDDKVQLAMQTYEMVWPYPRLPTTSRLFLGVLHPSFSVLGSVWGLGDTWILP